MACEKWVDRYELWKEWQKNCRNPWLYKILVLLGLAQSPTFEHYVACRKNDKLFDEELEEMIKGFYEYPWEED